MSKQSKFYIILKIITGCIGTISLGVSTNFLLKKNIDFFQLSIIYSLILGTSLLFEYFSGNWADMYGRKKIYAYGLIITAFQYLFYGLFSNVIMLYLAGIFGGLGDALISGSFEAWLTQVEKEIKNKKNSIHKVFSITRSLTSVFSIISSFLIGLFLKINLSIFYWGSCAAFLFLGILSLIIFDDNKGIEKSNLSYTIGAVKDFIKNPIYIFLSMILALTYSSYSIFILIWQPKAIKIGFSSNKLTLIYSLYLIGVVISSDLYRRYGEKVDIWIFLLSSFFLISIGYLVMYFTSYIYLIGLFLYGVGFGSIIPIFFTCASKIVDGNQCASLLSLMNGISSLASVITTTVMGKIIQVFSLNLGILIGLILGIISFFIMIVIKRYLKRSKIQLT